MTRSSRFAVLISGFLYVIATCQKHGVADEEPFELECRDGFVLNGVIAEPDDRPSVQTEKVVILLHGSGPQSMDADLSVATEGGKRNLFFRDVSGALVDAGFTVVRYHKRSHQSNLRIAADRSFAETDLFLNYAANPLKYFVDDAIDCVRQLQDSRPDAEIYLLGHSQGCYVGLQAAHQVPEIDGVGLIGFAMVGMEVLYMEQMVYRPMGEFRRLDTDGDEALDAEELDVDGPLPARLRPQMPIVDLDGNGSMSFEELKAGNLSNLLIGDLGLAVMTRQEATYPRLADILRDAEFKVIFLQGLWDNQTPAYHAKAVELTNRHVWKKENFRFKFFPELGHVLDRRDSYEDVTYDTIDTDARQTLADELQDFF